jgi:hypothetical protein
MTWLRRLGDAQVGSVTPDGDRWRRPPERLHGQIGDDGIERITTQRVLDVLGVPQRARRSGTYHRLAKLMAELGWSAVRGLTRGSYLEQMPGFARCPVYKRVAWIPPVGQATDRPTDGRGNAIQLSSVAGVLCQMPLTAMGPEVASAAE